MNSTVSYFFFFLSLLPVYSNRHFSQKKYRLSKNTKTFSILEAFSLPHLQLTESSRARVGLRAPKLKY